MYINILPFLETLRLWLTWGCNHANGPGTPQHTVNADQISFICLSQHCSEDTSDTGRSRFDRELSDNSLTTPSFCNICDRI